MEIMEFFSHINIVDVIAVILLIFFSYKGYICGFFNILFDSLAIIVSFYAANQYSVNLKEWMEQYLKFKVTWGGFASYILVYMLSFLFFIVWGRIITKIFKMSPVSVVNSISGMILNFIKWLLLIFIGLMIIENITVNSISEYIHSAYVYKVLNNVSQWEFIKEFIPNL